MATSRRCTSWASGTSLHVTVSVTLRPPRNHFEVIAVWLVFRRNRCLSPAAGQEGQAPTAAQPEPVPPTTPPGSLGPNSWLGWARSFLLRALGCGGDIRLIAFITDPGPIRKILTHLGEPLEPPPVSPTRGPPADWGELVQVHFRPGNLSGTDRRAARHRHPQPLTASHATVRTAREKSGFKAGLRRQENPGLERGQEAPRHLHHRAASSPIGSGCCSS
jgi:hypothetical protein